MPDRSPQFPEWSAEMLKKLEKVDTKLEKLEKVEIKLENLTDNYNRLNNSISQLSNLITGNGTPERGILIRLDRIEQAEKRRENWIKVAVGSAVSCALSVAGIVIKTLLSHH